MPRAAAAVKRIEAAFPAQPKDALQRLLVALERPFIDPVARARLERLLKLFGEEHVVLLVRTIIESDGNQNALIEPIISALSHVMVQKPDWPNRGLFWIEAFDEIALVPLLETMRALKCFTPSEGLHFYSISLRNQLRGRFEPPAAPPPPRPGPKTGRKHNRNTPRYLKMKGGG